MKFVRILVVLLLLKPETFGFDLRQVAMDWLKSGQIKLARCGKDHGEKCCEDSKCCSRLGYCGTGPRYCEGNMVNKFKLDGCQQGYGLCLKEKTNRISPLDNLRCGAENGECPSGTCCSALRICGISDSDCDPSRGCQSLYGSCLPANYQCGLFSNASCEVSGWCCGADGFCGRGPNYCDPSKGCIGNCSVAGGSSYSTILETKYVTKTVTNANSNNHSSTLLFNTSTIIYETSTPPRHTSISNDGSCDINNRCPKGACCSIFGFCGYTAFHCSPDTCQYQCWNVSSTEQMPYLTTSSSFIEPTSSPILYQCGPFTGNRLCDSGCCSKWGFCGTSDLHCKSPTCIYQCDNQVHPSKTIISKIIVITKENNNQILSTFTELIPKSTVSYMKTTIVPHNLNVSSSYLLSSPSHYSSTIKNSIPTDTPTVMEQTYQCGPNTGNIACEAGCCSIWGYCGTSDSYCSSPGCLYQCDQSSLSRLAEPTAVPGGMCGFNAKNSTCPGKECCSVYGFCGLSDLHCKEACLYQCHNSA